METEKEKTIGGNEKTLDGKASNYYSGEQFSAGVEEEIAMHFDSDTEENEILEEEIGVNEATLESLHEKMKKLVEELDIERKIVAAHGKCVEDMCKNQQHLRESRDENARLLKLSKGTFNKCLCLLKEKLPKAFEDKYETKGDINFINEVSVSSIDSKDSSSSYEQKQGREELKVDYNAPTNFNPAPNHSVKTLSAPVTIEPLHTKLEVLERLWAQGHINKNSIQVIHPPIHSCELLNQIIQITQREILARRWKRRQLEKNHKNCTVGDEDNPRYQPVENQRMAEEESIWDDDIHGTCLDIFAHIQHDPYLSESVQVMQMLSEKEKPLDSENMKTDKVPRKNDNLLYSSATFESDDKLIDIYSERKGVNEIDEVAHHCIDANAILCPYELSGTCADSSCPYQHLVTNFSIKHSVESISKHNTVALPELKLPQIVDDSGVIIENLSITLDKSKNSKRKHVSVTSTDDNKVHDGTDIYQTKNPKNKKLDYSSLCNASAKVLEPSQLPETKPKSTTKLDFLLIKNDLKVTSKEVMKPLPIYSNISSSFKENNYINLPQYNDVEGINEDENSDDKNDSINKNKTRNNLWYRSESIFLSDHETLQRKSQSLSNVLLLFGFLLIEQTEGVDAGKNQVHYNLEEYTFVKDRKNLDPLSNNLHIEHAMRSLMFVAAISDTIRLCVSASRFDICFTLLHIVKTHVTEVLKEIEHFERGQKQGINEFRQKHFNIFAEIVEDVKTITERALFGKSSISYYSTFGTQVSFSIITNMLGSYYQILLEIRNNPFSQKSNDTEENINYMFPKRLLRFFQKYKDYKDFKSLEYVKRNSGDIEQKRSDLLIPRHILPERVSYCCSSKSRCSPEKRMEILYQCVASGESLARTIGLHDIDDTADPQLLLQKILYPLSQRIQCYLSKSQRNHVFYSESSCKICSADISGNFAHLVCFFVFGPTILTCLGKMLLLIRKDRNNKKLGKLNARTHGIVLSAYKTLVEILHYLEPDTSSITNLESCLAAPFYSVMVLLLVSLGSFTKAQTILQDILFSECESNNKKSKKYHRWFIYSEILWSQLIQLRMSYPSEGISQNDHGYLYTKAIINRNIVNAYFSNCKSQSNDDQYLARNALHYGIHISKLWLKGDSSFMNLTTYFMNICKFTSAAQLDNSLHIQSIFPSLLSIHDLSSPICNSDEESSDSIADTKLKSCSKPLINNIAVNFELLRRSIDGSKVTKTGIHSRSEYLPTLPTSFLLFGNSLHKLQVNGCGLRSLPLTIGVCLPKLKVLNVSCNKLQEFPETLCLLKDLTTLNASENYIEHIPHFLGECESLKEIDFGKNMIKNVPSSLPLRLLKLSSLILDKNPVAYSCSLEAKGQSNVV